MSVDVVATRSRLNSIRTPACSVFAYSRLASSSVPQSPTAAARAARAAMTMIVPWPIATVVIARSAAAAVLAAVAENAAPAVAALAADVRAAATTMAATCRTAQRCKASRLKANLLPQATAVNRRTQTSRQRSSCENSTLLLRPLCAIEDLWIERIPRLPGFRHFAIPQTVRSSQRVAGYLLYGSGRLDGRIRRACRRVGG